MVRTRNGRVEEVVGDPDNPINRGKLCSKAGIASLEQLYHPDRLNYPLLRAGKRGEGRWRRATWDEALAHIAEKMQGLKAQYGAESVAFARGVGMNNQHIIARLTNLFGTPNLASISYVCYATRVAVCSATATGKFGGKTWDTVAVPDFFSAPRCVVEWGSQKRTSNDHGLIGFAPFTEALRQRPAHILVDPRKPSSAGEVDLWLPVRPGSDAAMALGWINLIIEEELYDKAFVEKHCHGFEELRARARDYPLPKVADLTWCDPEQIARAARLYATTRPGCIVWGNGLEHVGRNSFQSLRAALILMGITGNLDVPGGNVFYPAPPLAYPDLKDKLSPEQDAKRIGGKRFKALNRAGFAHPPSLFRTIISGEPYPVRGMVVVGSNLATTYPNTARVLEALNKLDLLVVHDIFMTPTAEYADVVLPAAANLERDEPRLHLHIKGPHAMFMDTVSRKVTSVAERKSDWEFIIGLGQKLGYGEYFPSLESLADESLWPMGITWEELRARDYVEIPIEYRKYEKSGFGTPTGKFEIYSTVMKDWGYDPLPSHVEPVESPLTMPERHREYPLILITGAKQAMYYHSQGRQLPSLRHLAPEPLLEMHRKTAQRLGIDAGEFAWVETVRGRLRLKVHTHERMHPGVVMVPHGWWLPEQPGPDHGLFDVCVNVLTDDDPDICDLAFGGSPLKGLLCRVVPAAGT
ncbi:MAG: molybdopterin oxidoreductase [Betaproteobacteria bacterium]|nr:molybdopterin oxidoreductase [Betaproteobacteria bacterium]